MVGKRSWEGATLSKEQNLEYQNTPCCIGLPKESSWDGGGRGSAGRRPPGTPQEYSKPGWEEELSSDSLVKVR